MPLTHASEREGWQFVRRLIDEATAGVNCFDRPGEAFFIAASDDQLIGVCGLNIDPFAANDHTGRVRRLYVLPEFRGRGIAMHLVQAVIAAAGGSFTALRVRTDNESAARLYERLGFVRMPGAPDCMPVLTLAGT